MQLPLIGDGVVCSFRDRLCHRSFLLHANLAKITPISSPVVLFVFLSPSLRFRRFLHRFRVLADIVSSEDNTEDDIACKTAVVMLINSIVNSPDSLFQRQRLRNEFVEMEVWQPI